MYRVLLYRDAQKFLYSLSKDDQERIRTKLKALGSWPAHELDIKPMAGEFKGYHRLRVGPFRALFVVDAENQTIYIDHLGRRGDVY